MNDPVDEITAVYQAHEGSEFGKVCVRITQAALRFDEFHADHAADWRMRNRNMLGVAVRHLQKNGVLKSTGEHRQGSSRQSHKRRSYVYHLTESGRRAATLWRERSTSRMDMWPPDQPDQAVLDLAGAMQ